MAIPKTYYETSETFADFLAMLEEEGYTAKDGTPIKLDNYDEICLTDINKVVWSYVREWGLNEGQEIVPDEELGELLGTKPLKLYNIVGTLQKKGHITKL